MRNDKLMTIVYQMTIGLLGIIITSALSWTAQAKMVQFILGERFSELRRFN